MHLRRPYLNLRVLTIFLIAAVPLLVFGLRLVLSNAQDQLRDSFGRQLEQAAERTAVAVDAYVYRRIIDVSLLARQTALRDAADAANRAPYDERTVAELDRALSARRVVPPALASTLQSPASKLLRDLVQHDPVYREILLTDRHGRLAAASNVSTDYFQGDEEWWRAAFDGSAAGRLIVSDVRWDDSARVYGLEIASPVTDSTGARTSGVLKVVADVREMLAAVAGVQAGDSAGAMLIRRDGSIVFSRGPLAPGARFFANDVLQERLRQAADPQVRHHFVASTPDGRKLVGVAPSQLALSYPNLSWLVAIWQSEDELLAPTQAQMWQLLLVLALTVLVVLALALWFSMHLVAPPTDVDIELVEHAKVHQIDERQEEPAR